MTRIALITGAGGTGIGATTARVLAEEGYRVVASDLDAAAAEAVALSLPGEGHRAFRLDVADEDAVIAAFDTIETEIGPVAVLVTAAGTMIAPADRRPTISDMATEAWDRTFDVNLRGTFFCVREMLRRRERDPVPDARMVLISSAAGQTGGMRGGADYACSKAAVIALSKSAAREAAPLGMTVNNIAPGPISTPLYHAIVNKEMEAQMIASQPIRRMGQPREIADMVAYLVSEKAGYITGSTVDVNGGSRMQ